MDMTLREMNLRVFQRKPIPHVFFQPRFEPWFDWHQRRGSLPAELRDCKLRDAYDRIHASMRTVHYYTGQPDPITVAYAPEVRITQVQDGIFLRTQFETPHGVLSQTDQFTVDETWRTVEFLAKGPEDLPALRWLLERRSFHFSEDNFEQGASYLGDRGVPQFWVPKSPYFALAQQLMRYEDFIYALVDQPAAMEEIMTVIDASYDGLYEELIASGRLQILNFGENVAQAYLSRRYFERYVLPWYHKRSGQLRQAGIFTHIHIDGDFRMLLPYLAEMPFDGLEALTPTPQGDVALEEMAEAMGDKILLDGIPAVLFLEHYTREALMACVEKIVKLFHPRLVLGISDELPEGGGNESWERLKLIAQWCRDPSNVPGVTSEQPGDGTT